jgi:anti-sigma B factor antagonist
VNELARVEVERTKDGCLIRVFGEIDMSNAAEVSAHLEAAVPNDARVVTMDLSHTRYLDSAGVHLLFVLADRLRARRQAFRLIVPQESTVRSLLELAGVPVVVPLDDPLDAEA